MHKYDIANNSWTRNASYEDLKFQHHDVSIDNETNTLYALGTVVLQYLMLNNKNSYQNVLKMIESCTLN